MTDQRKFYYSKNGTDVQGPVGVDVLSDLLRASVLNPSTNVCLEGTEEWMPVEQIARVPPAATLSNQNAISSPATPGSTRSNSWISAILILMLAAAGFYLWDHAKQPSRDFAASRQAFFAEADELAVMTSVGTTRNEFAAKLGKVIVAFDNLKAKSTNDMPYDGMPEFLDAVAKWRSTADAWNSDVKHVRDTLVSQWMAEASANYKAGKEMMSPTLGKRQNALPGVSGGTEITRMVSAADEITGVEFEAAHGPAGDLTKPFQMRGFEGFTLPPELAKMPTVGTRVFKQGGQPVAQFAFDSHNSLLYVFRASDFGVSLPQKANWTVFTCDSWVAAVRERDAMCIMVAFRGKTAEMQQFLKSLSP